MGAKEATKERFIRKTNENPLVPIGFLATTVALLYGLWCLRTGQKKMSQYMMRTRVFAQGITILAVFFGVGITARNFKKE